MLEPALLLALFFGPLAFGCVEPWSLAILQAVLFSLPLLAGLSGGRPLPAASKIGLLAIGVILAVGAAQVINPISFFGPVPLLPFTASPSRTRHSLLLWASFAALIWAAPRGFAGSRAVQRFAWAIVLIGFTIAVIGIIQSAHGNKLVLGFREVGYGRSPFGPYYNRGHAASLMAICALVGAGLLGSGLARALGRSRQGESAADAIAVQVLLAFMLGVIALGLFSTRNRGSLLALWGASMIVGLLSCGFLKRTAPRWGARAAILAVYLGAAGAAYHLGFLARGEATSVPVRLSMYQSGLRLLADVPVWGTGLGTVITVFEPYKEAQVIGIVDHVHNDWLELPLQAGIPAALFALAALLAFGRRVYLGWTSEPSPERRLLIGGGIAAAVCFLLHAMVEFTWQIPANAVVFLLIMSWISAQTAKV